MEEGHNIKDEVKKYYKVFFALAVLTVITVALNNLEVGVALAIVLALIVATIKASLVASFFMHLIAEKKLIYVTLIFTMFFFSGLIFLTVGSFFSVPEGTKNLNYNFKQEMVYRGAHVSGHDQGHATSETSGNEHVEANHETKSSEPAENH